MSSSGLPLIQRGIELTVGARGGEAVQQFTNNFTAQAHALQGLVNEYQRAGGSATEFLNSIRAQVAATKDAAEAMGLARDALTAYEEGFGSINEMMAANAAAQKEANEQRKQDERDFAADRKVEKKLQLDDEREFAAEVERVRKILSQRKRDAARQDAEDVKALGEATRAARKATLDDEKNTAVAREAIAADELAQKQRTQDQADAIAVKDANAKATQKNRSKDMVDAMQREALASVELFAQLETQAQARGRSTASMHEFHYVVNQISAAERIETQATDELTASINKNAASYARQGLSMKGIAGAHQSNAAAMDAGAGRGRNFGLTMIYASQALEDLQYGFNAVVNNIPPLVNQFGQLIGIAPGVSMAFSAVASMIGVVTNQILKHWDETKTFGENLEKFYDKMAEWGSEKFKKPFVDSAGIVSERLKKLEKDFKEFDENTQLSKQAGEKWAILREEIRKTKVELDYINEAQRLFKEQTLGSKATIESFRTAASGVGGAALQGDVETASKAMADAKGMVPEGETGMGRAVHWKEFASVIVGEALAGNADRANQIVSMIDERVQGKSKFTRFFRSAQAAERNEAATAEGERQRVETNKQWEKEAEADKGAKKKEVADIVTAFSQTYIPQIIADLAEGRKAGRGDAQTQQAIRDAMTAKIGGKAGGAGAIEEMLAKGIEQFNAQVIGAEAAGVAPGGESMDFIKAKADRAVMAEVNRQKAEKEAAKKKDTAEDNKAKSELDKKFKPLMDTVEERGKGGDISGFMARQAVGREQMRQQMMQVPANQRGQQMRQFAQQARREEARRKKELRKYLGRKDVRQDMEKLNPIDRRRRIREMEEQTQVMPLSEAATRREAENRAREGLGRAAQAQGVQVTPEELNAKAAETVAKEQQQLQESFEKNTDATGNVLDGMVGTLAEMNAVQAAQNNRLAKVEQNLAGVAQTTKNNRRNAGQQFNAGGR